MLEALVNVPFQTVIVGPNNTNPPVPALYLGQAASGLTVTCTQFAGTPVWTCSFTPTATGLYTLVAFAAVQFRVPAVIKSAYSLLANIEDEAVGSWNWNKLTNSLTTYRQDGTVLHTYTVLDTLSAASRELI